MWNMAAIFVTQIITILILYIPVQPDQVNKMHVISPISMSTKYYANEEENTVQLDVIITRSYITWYLT